MTDCFEMKLYFVTQIEALFLMCIKKGVKITIDSIKQKSIGIVIGSNYSVTQLVFVTLSAERKNELKKTTTETDLFLSSLFVLQYIAKLENTHAHK